LYYVYIGNYLYTCLFLKQGSTFLVSVNIEAIPVFVSLNFIF